MRTTCSTHALWVGVDLTDAYAKKPRAIDVCGMDRDLRACFWQWTYEGGVADVEALLPEIRAARAVVLDGPSALAKRGAKMREAERLVAAAGKTPSAPPMSGPYAGFVRTSVELFAALDRAGVPLALPGGVAEYYPGGSWRRLAGRLPSKQTPEGLAARRKLLVRLGVKFPRGLRLEHDHLDACLGAVLAATADGAIQGPIVERIGPPLTRDRGVLREGPILMLSDRPRPARR